MTLTTQLAVEEHENDEPKLACTGEPLLGWPESPLKVSVGWGNQEWWLLEDRYLTQHASAFY